MATSRFPLWPILLLSAALLLVVAGMTVAIIYFQQPVRGSRAGLSKKSGEAVDGEKRKEETEQPDKEKPGSPVEKPTPSEKITPEVKKVDTPMSAKTPDLEPILSGLGTLTAAHLYQSYLNIGLLADGRENEIYSADEAKKQLQRVTSLMDATAKQLARIPTSLLSEDEKKHLKQVRELIKLLQTQASELKAYWESGDKDRAKRFHEARDKAWEGIKDLLDLDD